MSTHLILIDLLAIAFVVAGFHLAFRQRLVRAWLDSARARRGLEPLRAALADPAQDPAHYAMLIFGTMAMAFGIILFGFTTMYALVT
jgi:hypothetical protein